MRHTKSPDCLCKKCAAVKREAHLRAVAPAFLQDLKGTFGPTVSMLNAQGEAFDLDLGGDQYPIVASTDWSQSCYIGSKRRVFRAICMSHGIIPQSPRCIGA
jgi:hypothetical protein